MLAELNDEHTGVLWPSAQTGRRYFATGYLIGEARRWAVVVDEVGATAQAAGLERGDEVLAVDGRPIEEALDALPPVLGRRFDAAAAPRQSSVQRAEHDG
jgi:carboxyl-terminal processing protease